ncbi:replication initiation protein [Corynebacterium mucifaciens]|nr:replication initiation protein [Corynebacterium mucifaciens]
MWLIDPVYADKDGKSPNMALLAATSRTLGGFLDHDPNFAHRFSRSPFYTGESPDRYIWYRQHHRIDRLSDFIREVREVTDEPQHISPRQEFSRGRELIETVKGRTEVRPPPARSRAAKMPPMRDRQTRARHVRGYVTQGKTDSYGTPTAKYATTSHRKALATMDRRGGKKAAQRGNRPRRRIRPRPAYGIRGK